MRRDAGEPSAGIGPRPYKSLGNSHNGDSEFCKIERSFVSFCIAAATTPAQTVSTPLRSQPSPAPRASQKSGLNKGSQTRAAILDAALGLASQIGLEGLSIGALAEVTQMSKSGVFAHFGSREELQISVMREYHAKFEEEVFYPAVREARGLPRLRAMFERWVKRVSVEIDSGCIYISGAVEFDDRPGPGARRAGQHGAHLARRAGTRDPDRDRRGPPASRHRPDADAVRGPRPDPRAAPRRALHAQPGRARPRPSRLRAHRASTTCTAAGAAIDGAAAAKPAAPLSGAPAHLPLSVNLKLYQELPSMADYTPPLRDMQFVLHEVLKRHRRAEGSCRAHADVDADTINAVLEEGGKFAAEVLFPLNHQRRRAKAARSTRPRTRCETPKGFKEAYAQYVEGGWPSLTLRPGVRRPGPAARASTSACTRC